MPAVKKLDPCILSHHLAVTKPTAELHLWLNFKNAPVSTSRFDDLLFFGLTGCALAHSICFQVSEFIRFLFFKLQNFFRLLSDVQKSSGSYWDWRLHHYCVKWSFVWHFQLRLLKVIWKWIETRWGGNEEFSADIGKLVSPQCHNVIRRWWMTCSASTVWKDTKWILPFRFVFIWALHTPDRLDFDPH